MNLYTSNLKPAEAIALKQAHQQLAGIMANGKTPPALMCRASRIQADGQWQASIRSAAYEGNHLSRQQPRQSAPSQSAHKSE